MKREAIIFKKEPLSTYHLKVNEAAQQICLHKLSLLRNRAKLLVLAKEEVHNAGYVYRKGKSRSKVYGSEVTPVKRVKTSAEEHLGRMKGIKEELADISVSHSGKKGWMQRRYQKTTSQLSEEIADLNKTKRVLELEINALEKKANHSGTTDVAIKEKATVIAVPQYLVYAKEARCCLLL